MTDLEAKMTDLLTSLSSYVYIALRSLNDRVTD